MQYKQLKICFFVAYLGLLINLGPSLHHAEIFGFHSHSDSDSGCCHVHSAHSPCCHTQHADLDSSDELTVRSKANGHDCPFCKFFDQYHVIVEPIEAVEVGEFSPIRATERPSEICSVLLIPLARGPPATV